jgi:hypothetical protein
MKESKVASAERKWTPEEQKRIDTFLEMFGKRNNVPEEILKKYISVPFNQKFALRVGELRQYKLVAEVVKSEFCDLKVGQKFVFSCAPSTVLVEECTARLCIKALGPLGTAMVAFWDRIPEGVEPNGGAWEYVQCLDQGVERGGLGNVLFHVYAVKSVALTMGPPGEPVGGPPG